MVEVRFSVDSSVPPERVLAAAIDFSPKRPEVWSALDPARYRLHALGDTWADVTEGGTELGGIWARERYDWAQTGRVVAEVQESNVFRPPSRWELRVEPAANGGSRVEWITVRHPKGLKGRILVMMLAMAGRKYLAEYLRRSLATIQPATLIVEK